MTTLTTFKKITYTEPTLVSLIKALHSLAKNEKSSSDLIVNQLKKDIGEHEHYVFILIDGLGANLLDQLSPDGILKNSLYKIIRTVFPSTTASAITSLTTGAYPSTHSITGWWTYLPQYNLTSTVLPFVERFSGNPLSKYFARIEDVFLIPSIFEKINYYFKTYIPLEFKGSIFSTYSSGGKETYGYSNLQEALEKLSDDLQTLNEPSLSYIYYPSLDSTSHAYGYTHPKNIDLLHEIDTKIKNFKNNLNTKVRIIITADHGHTIIPKENQLYISDESPLMNYLQFPPSGEPRVPIFHVKKGSNKVFKKIFNEIYGEYFYLLSNKEVEKSQLLGPGALTLETKKRIGDFLAVAKGNHVLSYLRPHGTPPNMVGFHAGLSDNEMNIPVFLI